MSDIFISYARADRALAEGLARDLQARGYRVWWDAELVGSDDFYEVILEALRQAKAAVVIWTKASAKSRFVRDEARFALHFEKLVAVKGPDLDHIDIPFGFQGQLTDDVGNREQIVRAVEKLGVRPFAGGPVAATSVAAATDPAKLKASSIDELVAFLGTNPQGPAKGAALARLKELASSPSAAAGPSALVRSLTMSNWQAFLQGLTFRVPKFQLTSQGTWSSVGVILLSTAIAVLGPYSYNFLSKLVTQQGHFGLPSGLEIIIYYFFIVAISAIFVWRQMAIMLKQKNMIASYTSGHIF